MPPLLSPDATTIALADYGGAMVLLHDLPTNRERGVLRGDNHPGRKLSIVSTAFSPDGKTLAAGSHDGSVWVWDVSSGRLNGVFGGGTGPDEVVSLGFTPDGRRIVSESRQPRGAGAGAVDSALRLLFRVGLATRIEVRDAASGRLEAGARGSRFFPAMRPAVTGDGHMLATCEGPIVRLWRLPK
jgi:hypothetical protein